MNKKITALLCLMIMSVMCLAQGTLKVKVFDKKTDEAVSFVNVRIQKNSNIIKGGITDADGVYNASGLAFGQYEMQVSLVGYKTVTKTFSVSKDKPHHSFSHLFISEDEHTLGEVTVTGQKSSMRLEVDRKSYDVDQQIANAGGSASDVLENIPSVEVDNEGTISLRGNSSVEVWINGKASGLTSDNRGDILQQLPAESIERIEVITSPSAKYSPEGSSGIINIILKKDRKAGYYGSIQANGNTRGGWGLSGNINYNSSKIDAYANVGYRKRKGVNKGWSEQDYINADGIPTRYQNNNSRGDNSGGGLFSRAGLTWHAGKNDDLTLSGMVMFGGHNNTSNADYQYGTYLTPGDATTAKDNTLMQRHIYGDNNMKMYHGEFNWEHRFGEMHKLEFLASHDIWNMDNDNVYQDKTTDMALTPAGITGKYQFMPMHVRNHSSSIKLDYQNQFSAAFKLEAGYNGDFSKENTPQESYAYDAYDLPEGVTPAIDELYYNRFIYKQNIHALYATVTTKVGNLGVMAGLRGEYWNVNTESHNYAQEMGTAQKDPAYKKDFFQLFPSLYLSYQLTKTQQLQLNFSRRLRRPWGGQLNSFIDRRDASNYSFGNPQLTPEFTNALELNYLKQWDQHTLSISAYYRPTTDVMQQVRYQAYNSNIMYTTQMNVAKSQSSGVEIVAKNKLFRIIDLTTTINGYYYKLDAFNHDITVFDPTLITEYTHTVKGNAEERFTWSGRIMASIMLPWGVSMQASGNYSSKRSIIQGYQEPSYTIDLGLRKTFLNRTLALNINCRDLLNSRCRESFTNAETFRRHQMNMWGGRRVNFSLTYNFGSSNNKRRPMDRPQDDDDNMQNAGGYDL